MSERDIQNRILVALTEAFHPHGIFWTNDTGTARTMDGKRVISFGLKGSPDILGCLQGRFVGVEVKSAKGKQREAQKAFQTAFEKAGGVYLLARTEEAAVAALRPLFACE